MAEKVTIHDVAREAKVSIATVSRVLNNLDTVKGSTRDLVLHAARMVGYKLPEELSPKQANSSSLFLVFLTTLGSEYMNDESNGILSTAKNYGYDCLFYPIRKKVYSYQDFAEIAEKINCRGIFMTLPNVPEEIIHELQNRWPVVQFSEYTIGSDIPYVSADDYKIAKKITSYLIRTGRKNPIMLNSHGDVLYKYAIKRQQGFKDALIEAGIDYDDSREIRVMGLSVSDQQEAAAKIFEYDPLPDAIFAVSDTIAMQAISAIKERGLRIPEDIAVCGCENLSYASYSSPRITTVDQPRFRIGQSACELMMNLINGLECPTQIDIDCDILVRETT